MATVKVILRVEKQNKQGEAPLYLRITQNRQTKFLALGYKIRIVDWDPENQKVRKGDKRSSYLNALIANKIAEITNEILKIETSGYYSFPEIKKRKAVKSEDFFSYAASYLEQFKLKCKIGSYNRVNAVINKLKEYWKKDQLPFELITVNFVLTYENYLRSTLGNKSNTVHGNFKVLKKILNQANLEGIIKNDSNPFLKVKVRQEKVNKCYLTEAELSRIENLEISENSNLFHHRNMFIFSAYSAGLRISDLLLLKWKGFDGEKLTFNIRKTGTVLSVQVPNKGLELLEYYQRFKKDSNSFIFPMLKIAQDEKDENIIHKAVGSATSYGNDDLKQIAKLTEIDKNVSFHIARHTWATRALRKGMRIEYVSRLMGHASIKETQVYAKIVDEELNKAMEIFN